MANCETLLSGLISIIISCGISIGVHAGDDTPIEVYRGDLLKIFNSKNLYWYGLDFSNLKFTDEKSTNGDLVKKVYCPGWLDFFYSAYSKNRISGALKRDDILFVHEQFQADQINKIRTNEICDFNQNNFNRNQIASVVEDYDLPPDHDGVGFAIIVENFTKIYHTGSYYMTFFDIKTRELLWVYKIIMNSGGHGYIEHWGNPTYKSFHVFQNDFYKKEYRRKD
jgi:hypothetical protein